MSQSPPKGATSKYYHIRDQVSSYEFWGDIIIQPITLSVFTFSSVASIFKPIQYIFYVLYLIFFNLEILLVLILWFPFLVFLCSTLTLWKYLQWMYWSSYLLIQTSLSFKFLLYFFSDYGSYFSACVSNNDWSIVKVMMCYKFYAVEHLNFVIVYWKMFFVLWINRFLTFWPKSSVLWTSMIFSMLFLKFC